MLHQALPTGLTRLALAALLVGLPACREPAAESPPVSETGPRLVVLLAVDQLAWDYLPRFDSLFEGGMRRLLDDAIVFQNAGFDHAVTVTGAGHAVLASGLHPSRSGIIGNGWYDRAAEQEVYCFADAEHGLSPRNLLGTTLADWIKEHDPRSKAYSASRKDRSAIAMGGLAADAALWYDAETGGFTSSSYYFEDVPDWLEEFNRQAIPARRFAHPWEPLPIPPQAAAALGLRQLDEGLFTRGFPYALGGLSIAPGESFWSDFGSSPFADAYVFDVARAVIDAEELGQRGHLDYLALGLSALDTIGHRYGPASPEVADVLLRLDRELGDFLDFLDRRVGADRFVLALSSDHGVAPVPEQLALAGGPGRRAGTEDALCFQRAGQRLQARFGLGDWVHAGFYLDREALADRGIEPGEVERALARELEGCDIVERVWTRTELQTTRTDEPDRFRRLYRHSYHPERSPDLLVQPVRYAIAGSTAIATHGSPYEYDTHVPLVLSLPGAAAARITEAVRIVDVAPTLARLLALPLPSGLDGRDLTDMLRERVTGFEVRPAYRERKPAT